MWWQLAVSPEPTLETKIDDDQLVAGDFKPLERYAFPQSGNPSQKWWK